MTKSELTDLIFQRRSFLCIGLDSELEKLPKHLLATSDPIFEFNKAIIDATRDYCVAYKPNLAFYEAQGLAGWQALEKTVRYIGKSHFTIADAKRGDIGNTSRLYAKAFFETLDFDAVTVAPYMGEDSVSPFLSFDGKWAILLALTSNKGADDFQLSPPLFEKVIRTAQKWGSPENLMFVIGATRPEMFAQVRKLAPQHFFLVPGVGAQGGDLEAVAEAGMNDEVGLLVNSSRGIIFAGGGEDFAEKAAEEAAKMQQAMAKLLQAKFG